MATSWAGTRAGWTGADTERLSTDATGRRRDIRFLAGAFTIGVLLYSQGVYTRPARYEPGWLILLPFGVICLALLLRRTAPLPAVLVALAAAGADQALGPFLGTVVIFCSILYDACFYGRAWVGRALMVCMSVFTVVLTVVALVLMPTPGGLYMGISAGFILVLPVLTAIEVRRYRDRADTERLRADQVANLAELDRLQAVAAERARMARELHDVVANHLSAIAIHATAAQRTLDVDAEGHTAPPQLRGALATIRESSLQGLREMRQMIEILREPGERPASARLADVGRLVDQADRAGTSAMLVIDGEPRPLPVAVDLAGYRIVQESLTNAVKHAGGGRVEVNVGYRPEELVVTVDSWGPAPDAGSRVAGRRGQQPVPGSGVGVIGMRERATLLGGHFTAGPHADRWRVHAVLPAANGGMV